jgi:16S rRNA (cytosine1402-N4)-methyltransferase
MEYHSPVLLKEVVDIFNVQQGSTYIDCTLGNGGHTIALLEKGAIVYGLDQDPINIVLTTNRISNPNLHPLNTNFNKLLDVTKTIDSPIAGVLLDLGLSSGQQKAIGRGFSFNDTDSLDMRLDPKTQKLTAEEVINTYSYDQLYDIFTKYAQENLSKPLIIRIIKERQQKPIKSGERLANIIRDYFKSKHRFSNNDPSTKIFMALRIFVNSEFENLQTVLADSLNLHGTQIVIISFHSGEDRIVKNFIRSNVLQNKIVNLTPKAILPTRIEIKNNPLSRSAVLRSYRIV